MGLAASQARLLFVTARKSDVEFQEMRVANQKIALSRESAEASETYSDALNARKLMWAVDGTSTGDKEVDLNYNLLMRPNSTADSGQYIFTNTSNGKVILDSAYASVIGKETGNAGDLANTMTQAAFLSKLMKLSETEVAPYVKKGNTTVNSTFVTSYNDAEIINNANLLALNTQTITLGADDNNGNDKSNEAKSEFEAQLTNIAGALGTALEDKILGTIGSKYSPAIEAALAEAKLKTFNQFANIKDTSDSNPNGSNQINNYQWSSKTGGFLGTGLFSKKKNHNKYQVSGQQIINTFLTYFDQACAKSLPAGTSSTSTATIGSSTTRGATGGTGASTTTVTPGSETGKDSNGNSIGDSYEASFYLNLYNALNSFGWQTNNDVQSQKYLQAQILYGNVEIKQMKGDGSWSSISTGDADCPLRNESDDAAIAKAEAEYNTTKLKIDSKEQKLDLEMKNLDTERSALDTEIDSVKAIINKNIERSFKMFQA